MKKAILEENASETALLGRMKRTELAESIGGLWICCLASVEGLECVEHWKDIPMRSHVGLEEVNSLNKRSQIVNYLP